jgi:hypothetical protein
MPYYAGIGSRVTPLATLAQMTELAHTLDAMGYTLRSGGAAGADTAFAQGTAHSEIFTARDAMHRPDWHALAATVHPNWPACQRMGDYVCSLHARNCAIVLGADLQTPVDFVACWTEGALGQGGTGQALRLATVRGIACFDLARRGALEALLDFAKASV